MFRKLSSLRDLETGVLPSNGSLVLLGDHPAKLRIG
jgi:hypothetical protein